MNRYAKASSAGSKAKLLLSAAMALALTLVLGVSLAGALAPVLTIENAKDVEFTTAHVEGTVNPEDHETSFHFEYISDEQYLANEGNAEPLFQGASEVGFGSLGENAGATPVSENLSGLQPETKYHLRLIAINSESETVEAVAASTFTTKAVAKPLISGLAVSETHFSGMVNPNAPEENSKLSDAAKGAFATHWRFSCEPSCSFSGDSEGDLKADNAAKEVFADPTGLTPNQQYDVTLHATNAGGETSETKVAAFKTAAVKPTIERATLFELKRTSVELRGSIDPQNAPLTDCHYLYGAASLTEHEVPCEDVNELQQLRVSAEAGQFRLSFEGEKTEDINFNAGAVTVQAALQALPAIGAGNVSVIGGPGDNVTFTPYYVTFIGSLGGKDVEELGAENGTVPLSGGTGLFTSRQGGSTLALASGSARLSGLTPATEYHFQLLAANSAGTTEGAIRSFTTPAEPVSETCPNQSFRETQHSTYLPDCRAYEMVSPLDKGNGDIVGDGITNLASVDGDAVTLSTRTPFGDTIGSGVSGQSQYVARRSAAGWLTHGVTPLARSDNYQTVFGPIRFQAYSEDLRTAVVWGYDLPGATGALPLRNNIYVEDLASRSLQTVTQFKDGLPNPLPHPIAELGDDANWGVSADARHVAFVSSAAYLPQAAAGFPNVYQWDDGVLSLAGVLPDGTVPASGSDAHAAYRSSMSEDGTRLLFTASAGGNPRLYQRIDGTRTAWVSETELDPSDPNYQPDPSGVGLLAATPDGRNVFFTTGAPLLSEDTNEAADLYRWTDSPDPANDDNLTLITKGGFDVQVIGMSDDGERVYYHTTGNQIFAWDHGTTILVASGVPGPPPNPGEGFGVMISEPGLSRVSPDGRYLAIVSEAERFGSGPTGEVTNGHREMYLYSLDDDTLRCISCPSGPATADVSVKPGVGAAVIEYKITAIRPRFLSADGKVFFSTAETLLPEDTNGIADTYQYDPATASLTLISSGHSSLRATFTDASASGNDVFLVTREQLAPSDTDALIDLYDAHAGGGFNEPIAPPHDPCSGERCQGAAGQAPPLASPASQAQGRGNVPGPRCRKPRGKKQGAARKKRCTKRAKAHKTNNSKRAANTDRRAAK